jgi:hypothetical protein
MRIGSSVSVVGGVSLIQEILVVGALVGSPEGRWGRFMDVLDEYLKEGAK